jgi:DNA-binding transcriptional regulator PaaX
MRLLKKKLLLALSLPGDFLETSNGFDYKPYKFFYFLLPSFCQGSIRGAIGQLKNSGEVDKIVRSRVPCFRLTAAGRERLLSLFPISEGFSRPWTGKWRVIIGVPNKLRSKIEKMGFSKFSPKVFIGTSSNLEEVKTLLLKNNLLGNVVFFETKNLVSFDNRSLAKKLWNLDEVSKKYHLFINQCKSLLKKIDKQKGLKNRDKGRVVEVFNMYFSLLLEDPGLPKRVLPDDWPADFARKKFLSIFDKLKT